MKRGSCGSGAPRVAQAPCQAELRSGRCCWRGAALEGGRRPDRCPAAPAFSPWYTVLDAPGQPGNWGVQQRRADVLAASRLFAVVERRDDPERAVHSWPMSVIGVPALTGSSLSRCRPRSAAHPLRDQVHAGKVGVGCPRRSRRSSSRSGGVQLAERVIVAAEALHDAGRSWMSTSAVDQPAERLASLVVFQVDREPRLLRLTTRKWLFSPLRAAMDHGLRDRALDLDDVRARSARSIPPNGPARARVTSRTRTPARVPA